MTSEQWLQIVLALFSSGGVAGGLEWLRRRQAAKQKEAEAERRQRQAEDAGRQAAEDFVKQFGIKAIKDMEGRLSAAEKKAETAEKRADAAEDARRRQQVEIDAMKRKQTERDEEMAELRDAQLAAVARAERAEAAERQAQAAVRRANEERDTATLEKAQLDAQHQQEIAAVKDEQARAFSEMSERIRALETGRQTDKADFERRYAAREEEHRQELATRDEREKVLTSERDGALNKVEKLEQQVNDLQRQLNELTTELRTMKATAEPVKVDEPKASDE